MTHQFYFFNFFSWFSLLRDSDYATSADDNSRGDETKAERDERLRNRSVVLDELKKRRPGTSTSDFSSATNLYAEQQQHQRQQSQISRENPG